MRYTGINMKLSFKRIILGVLTVVLTAQSATQIVFADDIPFFSNNDILFYSDKACSVQNSKGDIAIIGNDNAEKIFKFLTSTSFKGTGDKPFNAIQAAGALGNFQQESGMDPSAIESNGKGPGHGLAQWTGGRKDILFNLATAEGKEWSDLGLQLKMIKNELDGEEGTRLLGTAFASVSDPVNASYVFQVSYERAGTPAQEKRDSAAKAYYEKFKDMAPTTSSSSSSSSGACGSITGGLNTFGGKDFTIYNQCQYPPYGGPWGTKTHVGGYTACATACGPTSLAMAVKNMTGQNITPEDTINYYDQKQLWVAGGSGSWIEGIKSGAEHWGLRTETIDTKDINSYKQVIDKGGLVIVAGYGAAPFIPQGHYIVIRGITPEGKFIIGDPGQSTSTNGTPDAPVTWDMAAIAGNSAPAGSAAIYKK